VSALLLSPFLNAGTVFVFEPVWVTAGDSSAAASFKVLLGISSSIVALCGLSPPRSLQTPLTMMMMPGIVGYRLGPNLCHQVMLWIMMRTDRLKYRLIFYRHPSSWGILQCYHYSLIWHRSKVFSWHWILHRRLSYLHIGRVLVYKN